MSKAKTLIFSLLAIVGTCAVGTMAYRIATGSMPWERTRAEIAAASEIHIQDAERKAVDAISKRVAAFVVFIEEGKAGAKPFSKDMVSWRGTWEAVKAKLPGTDADGHKQYIGDKFIEHIFNSEALVNARKRSIDGSIADIERIENELAIALRQELLGRSLAPSEIPTVESEFKDAIEQSIVASNRNVVMAAGGLVVTEVTSRVVTLVLIRLSVSTGILAAGAVDSWWSFGGTAVIGLAADAIWGWVTNPAGSIESDIVTELDKISRNESRAIEEGMNKVVAERKLLWRKTVKEALQ